MRLLDEASALAAGEEFHLPLSPGWALCCVIGACEGVGDFTRAAQWCERMQAVADRLGGRHMAGVCRSSYGSVIATGGDWPRAETELVAAVNDLEATRPAMARSGFVRLAQLRARQGRTREAAELFERARPHPLALIGLGTLALEDGYAQEAADAAERVLRRAAEASVVGRMPALELAVRAHAALGDLNGAGAAMAELEGAARAIRTPYVEGRARAAAGCLASARGDHAEARRAFEDALDRFTECSAPYEGALARVGLARALSGLGRGDAATREAAHARDAFTALGAARDVELASAPREGDAPPTDLSARELEVLRLVARGLSDAQIAERLFLSPHTVHRHVANTRAKLRLPSRAAAVGYAARHGLI
jgi:DNA-binding CsgD family transcriptional regulator